MVFLVAKKSRRAFIVAGSSVLFAGCGSSSGTGGSSSSGSTETIIDERDTVNEDQYLTYSFTLKRGATLDLEATVRSGPPLDIVFTSPDELEEFENGNRFRYNQELSLLDSAGGNATVEVPKGEYVLIVDNTNQIEAEPPTNLDDDNARVEILLTAR